MVLLAYLCKSERSPGQKIESLSKMRERTRVTPDWSVTFTHAHDYHDPNHDQRLLMLKFTFVCPKYHNATASSSDRQNPCEKSFQVIHHQDRDGPPSCTQSLLSAVNEQVAKCSLVT